MTDMSHELALGDVYLSPVLPVFSVALVGAWLTILVLNRLRLSRYIMLPATTLLALMTFYILLLNADGTVKAEQKISDTAGGLATTLDDFDRFGRSVAGIGDLDGD